VSERAIVKRLIDDAASRHLGPMGLRRMGRSRLWYDDRGWSLITVEFQPGSGVGTYLNVGATWLWREHGQGTWTFDEGDRLSWRDDGTFATEVPLGSTGWQQWASFIREQIFAKDIDVVADVASRRVRQLRDQLADPCVTASYLAQRQTRLSEDALWHAFNAGAAYALCGDPEAARQAFDRIETTDNDFEWRKEAHRQATELSLVTDPIEMRERVIRTIQTTRHHLRLTPWSPAAYAASCHTATRSS
jgi:hypothetical protein